MQIHHASIQAPFGAVSVRSCGMTFAIEFLANSCGENVFVAQVSSDATIANICEQIVAYLRDARFPLTLNIAQSGTDFQQRVWREIQRIPRGETRTYSQLAQMLGSGPRAVANACGANHLPILVPCHRVVAKNSLGGFMQGKPGGLLIKQWLLRHEGAVI